MPFAVTYFYLYSYLQPINFIGGLLAIAAALTTNLKETYSVRVMDEERALLITKNPIAQKSSFLNTHDID